MSGANTATEGSAPRASAVRLQVLDGAESGRVRASAASAVRRE
ncbi:hypothetical protein [Halococcus sp. AFM35]